MKKHLIQFLPLLLLHSNGNAQTTTCVTNNPQSGVTVGAACMACPGSNWTNEPNIYVTDGSCATVSLTGNGNCFQSTCYYSRFLYASDFGFSIPANAVIDSILVDIVKATNSPASAKDSSLYLSDGTSTLGANQASSVLWNTNLTNTSYGQSNPLWSYSWTPAIINATGFGTWFKVFNISPVGTTAAVDHIQVTICYTTPTGSQSVTSSPSAIKWITETDHYSAVIHLNGAASCSQYLYTSDGKLVLEEHDVNVTSPEKIFSFDSSVLAEGIYCWRIEAGENSYSQKIVIAK